MTMLIWLTDLFKESVVIPFHLKDCQPHSLRCINYLSIQSPSLEKHTQLPLTSVATTSFSGKAVGLCTASDIFFRPLHKSDAIHASEGWRLMVVYLYCFQCLHSALNQECALIQTNKQKKRFETRVGKCQWAWWGKTQCSQEHICIYIEWDTCIYLCLNVSGNYAESITFFLLFMRNENIKVLVIKYFIFHAPF